MLLYLAFSILILGTSLVTSQPRKRGQKGGGDEGVKTMEEVLNAIQGQLDDLQYAFYSVHNARTFATGSEKLYTTNEKEGNYQSANATCVEAGGHMPAPKRDSENQALQNVLKKRANQSVYLDRNVSGYFNWAPQEQINPDENKNCVAIDTNGKWRAISCEERLLIVCEFSFVP
ncbi:phospholipase A2 inhibitor alpha-like protein [Hemicordylus capensis]|uniref:phospholipase A2 inhibitor alpha-like protein n=1 Tax=Hemicordylus capensis TaxID=884348 RepID=UPI002303D676|nr:phospholipase A2 inhibitor alpha-like protein [Hemicordylus capensis]